MWTRPNSFATLVLIILEQQVSLQSAYAAFTKLSQKIKKITPQNLLQLTYEELRQCYFSRQKIGYVRGLATALTSQRLDLKRLALLPDDAIRTELVSLKGIGDWTVDIYLLHALQRLDVFPLGDLALVKAIKEIKGLAHVTKEDLIDIGDQWRPHRSIATMMLWHYYLQNGVHAFYITDNGILYHKFCLHIYLHLLVLFRCIYGHLALNKHSFLEQGLVQHLPVYGCIQSAAYSTLYVLAFINN